MYALRCALEALKVQQTTSTPLQLHQPLLQAFCQIHANIPDVPVEKPFARAEQSGAERVERTCVSGHDGLREP